MSCKYKDKCPSYSGWCNGPKQDFYRCVEFLITAYENERSKIAIDINTLTTLLEIVKRELYFEESSFTEDEKLIYLSLKNMYTHGKLNHAEEMQRMSGL